LRLSQTRRYSRYQRPVHIDCAGLRRGRGGGDSAPAAGAERRRHAMKPWLCLLALLLVGCGQPKSRLNIFIWSEYIDPQIVADFEKQFDCKVSLDLYEDNESMMAKLAGGGTALYDI